MDAVIDLNSIIGDGTTRVHLEQIDGPVSAGDTVIVRELEEGIAGGGVVARLLHRYAYVAVDRDSLRQRQSMAEPKQRILLERMMGKPLPRLAWTRDGLAVIGTVLAIFDPSTVHTAIAIIWSVLAAIRLTAVVRRPQHGHQNGHDPSDHLGPS